MVDEAVKQHDTLIIEADSEHHHRDLCSFRQSEIVVCCKRFAVVTFTARVVLYVDPEPPKLHQFPFCVGLLQIDFWIIVSPGISIR